MNSTIIPYCIFFLLGARLARPGKSCDLLSVRLTVTSRTSYAELYGLKGHKGYFGDHPCVLSKVDSGGLCMASNIMYSIWCSGALFPVTHNPFSFLVLRSLASWNWEHNVSLCLFLGNPGQLSCLTGILVWQRMKTREGRRDRMGKSREAAPHPGQLLLSPCPSPHVRKTHSQGQQTFRLAKDARHTNF